MSARNSPCPADRRLNAKSPDRSGLFGLPYEDALEQFQEKCIAVFRPELRKNKGLERFRDSVKR
jgi:hypothetical protein